MRESKTRKGRGAGFNPGSRFVSREYEREEDWFDDPDEPLPRTQFIDDQSRSILAENQSPDLGFNFSLNPYRGCEHGCIYCYARPYHEYLDYSAGLDFETKILVKRHTPELLKAAFMAKTWEPQVVALSGATDPYQPIEKKLELTRRCLEVFLEFKNPVGIVTKNALVLRDIDILKELAKDRLVTVLISITSLAPGLVRILEPRTSHPMRKLDTIRTLREAGVQTGVFIAPVIPGLTDSEMPAILRAAADAGASFAGFVPIKLPLAVAPLFEDWLVRHFPDRKDKVLNRIRDIRGGKLHDARFGKRMTGTGAYADTLHSLFHTTCNTLGLPVRGEPLSTGLFRRPQGPQLSMFA